MKVYVCTGVLLLSLVALSVGQNGRLFNCKNPGNPCLNGVACNYATGDCLCPFNLAGENCRINRANICTRDCGPNGICVNNDVCSCDVGYSGDSCQIAPMSCECSRTDMFISITPPGDFSVGIGFVQNRKGVPLCTTTPTGVSNQHTHQAPLVSPSCGNAVRRDLSNNQYMLTRTYLFRYIPFIQTNTNIQFTCNCVFGPNDGFLYASFGNVDPSNTDNLIKVNATGYIAPITYNVSMFPSGQVITSQSLVRIGDRLLLTMRADAGYCVRINSIKADNTMTSLYREALLVDNRCRTLVGQSVIESELQPNANFSVWTMIFSAFTLDNSNRVRLTISYTAFLSSNNCQQLQCLGTGRKRRQVGNPEAAGDENGSFTQVIIINEPEFTLQQPVITVPKECGGMDSKVMIGLIAMAGIICILLIVCFVIGLRMIMAKKREATPPPSYVK